MHTGIKLGILAAVLGGSYYLMNKKSKKDQLVQAIMNKYGDPKSPDYSKTFDAHPSKLSTLDEGTLIALYNGTLR